MKNYQKILAALLCLVMLLSVTACGSGGASGDNTAPAISGALPFCSA